MITEEEFWFAYIKQLSRNAIKEGICKILTAKSNNETRIVKMEKIAMQLEESSRVLLDVRDKTKTLDEKRQEKSTETKKASILRNEVFAFCGKEYRVTCRAKKLLIELEKCTGWTTAKELSGRVHETDTYICKTLHQLMNYGYPITSHMTSGKRFWALIRNESNDRVNNRDVVKTNPDLIIHALHLYNHLYGRPPSTSDIATQLKWDVTCVKNELSRLESQGKVKSEKIDISGKKIKTWKPAEVIEKGDGNQ
jgi:predicted transcriptional regulator